MNRTVLLSLLAMLALPTASFAAKAKAPAPTQKPATAQMHKVMKKKVVKVEKKSQGRKTEKKVVRAKVVRASATKQATSQAKPAKK